LKGTYDQIDFSIDTKLTDINTIKKEKKRNKLSVDSNRFSNLLTEINRKKKMIQKLRKLHTVVFGPIIVGIATVLFDIRPLVVFVYQLIYK
jgi:hypothetical protein